MTCSACKRAEAEPRLNDFTVGCESCKGRALAATGAHDESARLGKLTDEYKGALVALFKDQWKAGAALVKSWDARLKKTTTRTAKR